MGFLIRHTFVRLFPFTTTTTTTNSWCYCQTSWNIHILIVFFVTLITKVCKVVHSYILFIINVYGEVLLNIIEKGVRRWQWISSSGRWHQKRLQVTIDCKGVLLSIFPSTELEDIVRWWRQDAGRILVTLLQVCLVPDLSIWPRCKWWESSSIIINRFI